MKRIWAHSRKDEVPGEVVVMDLRVLCQHVIHVVRGHNEAEASPPLLHQLNATHFEVAVVRFHLGVLIYQVGELFQTRLRFGWNQIIQQLLLAEVALGTLFEQIRIYNVPLHRSAQSGRIKLVFVSHFSFCFFLVLPYSFFEPKISFLLLYFELMRIQG